MTDLQDRFAALSPAKRALLEKLRAAAPASEPIPRIPDGPAPLSAEQRRLWYLLPLAPGYPIYTISLGFRLHGALDAEALDAALRDLVARHEALRTALRESAGEPVQIVGDGAGFSLEVLDLREHEWADAEAGYQAGAFARRTFQFGRGDTFHALLLREGEDEYRLFLGIHHLAGDGWSAGVLLRELSALYAARLSGRPVDLPELPVRYRDWAAWQQRPNRPAPAADEAYWRAQLEGAPRVLELPLDRSRPPVQRWEGAKHVFELSPETTDAVRALARHEGATPYAVMAAAFALVLARYAGTDDLLLGTLLANRPRPEVEGVVGFFANTLPLRLRLDGDPTAGELVRRVHAVAQGAQEHASLPFDRIVELADVRRDFSRPPLVQAVLSMVESPDAGLHLPGVAAEPLPLDSGTAIFELTLVVEDRGRSFSAALQYADALFDGVTIRRMASHLEAALDALAADPARPLSRISLASDDEIRTVDGWSRGPEAPLVDLCVHQRFERQARSTPERTAIAWQGGEVRYADLDRDADRIARALRGMGVAPESRVAICLDRTPRLIAAMLGVMKAGGAFVPLDPAHPPARHASVLRISGARWAIAGDGFRVPPSTLPGVRLVRLDEIDREIGRIDGDGEPVADEGRFPIATAENLAYVIFTSGSTGGPKGVEIEHRSAVAMLGWMKDLLSDEERSGVLASTAVTFDVSVGEIFGTLVWGGTLVMVENALAPLPPRPPVRAAAMVPTAAAELLRENRFPASVETVLLGGEPVPLPLIRSLHELPSVRRVLNLYGPTEDTTYSTCAALEPGADRVPIGRPIAGGRIHVLDGELRPAGAGIPGEVWTAGAGVARGYANRPALTADRFRPDPYGPPGSRMYRTMDRGRWREDGQLEYLGRADAQVKVRGYRIELEEVEQALAAHPAVAEAAAVARGDTGSDRRLVAYLVPRDGDDRPEPAALRAFLRERLPEYMVPATFTWIDALPRTSSGKLDRRALPDDAGEAERGAPYVPPRDETEARLAALWSEVLGVERVGVHDDFFDLGGQSILATRLVARVRDEIGAEVPVVELLQGPTIEHMARVVTGKTRSVRLPLVPLQTFGDRPPLFLAHPAGGHVVCYRGLAVLLAMDQPVYAFQPRGVEDGAAPLETVEEMAASYVRAVREARPEGPYRLGGWSFGGVIAWEMARQLDASGAEVELLALFDTAPLTPEVISVDYGDPSEVLWHTVAGLAGYAAASRVDVAELRGLALPDQVALMLRKIDTPHLPESRADDVLALLAVRGANLRAQARYQAQPYRGRLTYFRTAGSDDERGDSPGLAFWSALAEGGITVHRVAGNHGTILHEPYVQDLAAAILAIGHPPLSE